MEVEVDHALGVLGLATFPGNALEIATAMAKRTREGAELTELEAANQVVRRKLFTL